MGGRTLSSDARRERTFAIQETLIDGMTLMLRVPPKPEYVSEVRAKTDAFLSDRGVGEDDRFSIELAMGEALANAMEHAAADYLIEANTTIQDAAVYVTIVDEGCGFVEIKESCRAMPCEESIRGRGFPLMEALVDSVTVRSLPDRGTAIILVRYIRSCAEPASNGGGSSSDGAASHTGVTAA